MQTLPKIVLVWSSICIAFRNMIQWMSLISMNVSCSQSRKFACSCPQLIASTPPTHLIFSSSSLPADQLSSNCTGPRLQLSVALLMKSWALFNATLPPSLFARPRGQAKCEFQKVFFVFLFYNHEHQAGHMHPKNMFPKSVFVSKRKH